MTTHLAWPANSRGGQIRTANGYAMAVCTEVTRNWTDHPHQVNCGNCLRTRTIRRFLENQNTPKDSAPSFLCVRNYRVAL